MLVAVCVCVYWDGKRTMEGTSRVLKCAVFKCLNVVAIKCTYLSAGLSICLCGVYRTFGTHRLMFMCELLCVIDLTTVY